MDYYRSFNDDKLSSIGLPGTVIALIIVLSVICKCRDNYEDKSRRNRWWN